MSTTIEWGEVVNLTVAEPGQVTDCYGNENERHALVAYSGSDGLCVEGSPEEIRTMLIRLLVEIDQLASAP